MSSTTTVTRLVNAPRALVYRALVSAEAVAGWRVPDGMRSVVHDFDARVGGAVRVSLTYDAVDAAGKTRARTDTYRGRFTALDPGERVVEELEFETSDPSMQGRMTMTTTLVEVAAGTRVEIRHEGLPDGVSVQDNETGTRMALERLAALVEEGRLQ